MNCVSTRNDFVDSCVVKLLGVLKLYQNLPRHIRTAGAQVWENGFTMHGYSATFIDFNTGSNYSFDRGTIVVSLWTDTNKNND